MRPSTGIPCAGGTAGGSWEWVSLGHTFETDVLQLEIDGSHAPATADVWWGLVYALVEAAADLLEISRDDLDATLHYGGGESPALVLFDDVPAGAGHVRRVRDRLEDVLHAAHERVRDCECGAETSCYRCLRGFRNQRMHDRLRRGAVAEFLVSHAGRAGGAGRSPRELRARPLRRSGRLRRSAGHHRDRRAAATREALGRGRGRRATSGSVRRRRGDLGAASRRGPGRRRLSAWRLTGRFICCRAIVLTTRNGKGGEVAGITAMGVDLSSSSANTAVARISPDGEPAAAWWTEREAIKEAKLVGEEGEAGLRERDALLIRALDLLRCRHGREGCDECRAVIAFDVPFNWPKPWRDLIRKGEFLSVIDRADLSENGLFLTFGQPDSGEKPSIFLRRTDNVVAEALAGASLRPLSPVVDRLFMTTMRFRRFFHAFPKQWHVIYDLKGHNIVQPDHPVVTVIETYPAAFAELADRQGRDSKDKAKRAEHVWKWYRGLPAEPDLEDLGLKGGSTHKRDAFVCAVAGLTYATDNGRLRAPDSNLPRDEGWIWLPHGAPQ